MATCLGISIHTVHTHLERLYRKLEVTSKCQVVVQLFAAYITLREPGGPAAACTFLPLPDATGRPAA